MFGKVSKKVSGYVIITHPDYKHELETRQCVHCGKHWVYQPGSGRKRGFCLACHGITCGSRVCDEHIPFEKKVEDYEKGKRLILNG